MRSGQLNRRLTLQHRTSSRDTAGQPIPSWSTVATIWADVRVQNGVQTLKADAEISVLRASIRIRYRTDINAGMRALLGSTVYDIEAVLPDESCRQYLDLVVTQGANDG